MGCSRTCSRPTGAEAEAVPIEVLFCGWREQPGLLRAGEADVAIVVEPFDTEGLDVEPLTREPQVLALPTGHPLAERQGLRLADVEAGRQRVAPGAHVYVRRGEPPPPFGDIVQMLRQIELGRMIALLPVSVAERTARPQLTWCRVDDAPEAAFAVAWPQNSRSRAVATFVRVATTVSASRAPGTA
ncbi:LysR substrate-binding domain-containing protein [Micromonospora sp. WMMD1120]|uniref:LysR substrate-binding domain-containing protein n=1 Tax=Micromonospora sp. WMMD1120 TaxID=3016106 RepID=UPI002416CF91|nr:LysR substrate-binding domain-containing protein [Micromonospora sp. WMMD1120]MDG4808758.1 LysR substrate-binding domain-containing protein [Micromonospora sp. WMMD1120]